MLRTGRADMVKSLLFKGQMLNGLPSQPEKQPEKKLPPPPESPKDPKSPASAGAIPKSKTRIIRIIEATKRLQGGPAEESKESEDGTKSKKEFKKTLERVKVGDIENEEDKIGPEDFVPIQLLGKGSFGEVYLVRHKDTGKLYAMKILNKKRVMGQNLLKYAKTERNVLCYTKHPFM